ATASGGDTIAPSATATAQGIPGKSLCTTTATTAVVTTTRPTASVPILSMFLLNSRTEVNIAADQRMGGRKTKKTRFGSSAGMLKPGIRLAPNPATSCRIGVGTGSRRASAESATTSTATTIAKTIGSKCGIAGSAGERQWSRCEAIS